MRGFLTKLFVAAAAAALTVVLPSTGAGAATGATVTGTTVTAATVTGAAAPTRTAPAATAAVNHTVTFVNHSSQKLWIGSGVNADGSKQFTRLPVLAPGQSATVTIPETTAPFHWRGKFFARQGCGGASGSTFHCRVADCGPAADHCTTGEQPASLAEFNFDAKDGAAPWYDVSYVNAFSLPITITPVNATIPAGGGCDTRGCAANLLPYCPPADLTRGPDGKPMLCTNPSRDTPSSYSRALSAKCPKAYTWSKQDQVPGNKVMQQCSRCSGFTVTFGPTA
ncbi:thaumatin family protein [Kitasatospora sp. NBC_01300]|uniref:thaumatin family protein n=1 Tax=Kitasatospora sp. NBC_01300 TaxID=2903574 RepID=UPI002F90EE2B|nr:Thaumatin pathogenesis-like protein [Kitasatospora sp. NBC_01300]